MTTASEDRNRLSFLLNELYDEVSDHRGYLDDTDTLVVMAEDMHRRFGSVLKTVRQAQAAWDTVNETTVVAEASLARLSTMTLVSDVNDDVPF